MSDSTDAEMRVRDVMTRDVVSTTPERALGEVADTMIRDRLRAIPVIDAERHVLGLITDRHVMGHFLPHLDGPDASRDPAALAAIAEVPVREMMERSVMCVKEDESLRDVARLMLDKEIERLPVVREGVLVGFLTRGDIIRRLLAQRDPAPPPPKGKAGPRPPRSER